MRTRSKANLGCGYGVTLVLVLIGVALLVQTARAFERGERVGAFGPAVVGVVILIGAVAYTRFVQRLIARQREEATWRKQFPAEPWKWRREWRGEAIASDAGQAIWVPGFFTLLWNAISWAAMLAIIAKPPREKVAYVVVLFPLIGLGMIAGLTVSVMKRRKFGVPKFFPASVPGVIGGYLGGVIEVPARVVIERDAELTLKCVRVVITGSGKQRRTTETVLWEQKENLAAEMWQSAVGRTEIPVMIYIPAGHPDSDNGDTSNRVEWRLMAKAEGPGVDFSAKFEVPVFATGETAPVPAEGKPTLEVYRAQPKMDETEWRRVGVERMRNGWRFSAQHLAGMKWVFTLIVAALTVLLAGLVAWGAPVIVWIVAGFFWLIMGAMVRGFWSGPTELVLEGEDVVVRRAGAAKEFRAKRREVADVRLSESMKVGERQFYRVILVGKPGAAFSGEGEKVPFVQRKTEFQLKKLERQHGEAADVGRLRNEVAEAAGFEVVVAKMIPGPRETEALKRELLEAMAR